jgi:hypothetical protein
LLISILERCGKALKFTPFNSSTVQGSTLFEKQAYSVLSIPTVSSTSHLDNRNQNQIIRFMKNDKDKRAKKRKPQATPRLAATRSVRTGRIISATRAARSFSELLDRVYYRGESFVIERGGELVCEMARVRPPRFTGSDFLSVVRSLPKPDPQYWKGVEEATKQRSTIPESPWES